VAVDQFGSGINEHLPAPRAGGLCKINPSPIGTVLQILRPVFSGTERPRFFCESPKCYETGGFEISSHPYKIHMNQTCLGKAG
jgi:hypothetical protein